jgi:hypothetical protein
VATAARGKAGMLAACFGTSATNPLPLCSRRRPPSSSSGRSCCLPRGWPKSLLHADGLRAREHLREVVTQKFCGHVIYRNPELWPSSDK